MASSWEQQKVYYALYPEKKRAIRQHVREIARERKKALVEMMGGKCVDCGYSKHPAALDFDHKNRETKQFNVGRMLQMKWQKILAEVEKCELRCANCHRVKTWDADQFKHTGRS